MAYLATEKCLKNTPMPFSEIREKMAVIVATSHGELESTVGFFEALEMERAARPLLFQSSLHNSTLGFLCKTFSLTGPGLTVSNSTRSGEDALSLADTLLFKTVDYCLVVGVDGLVPRIQKAFESMYPPGTKTGEGASALLLTNTQRELPYDAILP